jgi:hypothetical protein
MSSEARSSQPNSHAIGNRRRKTQWKRLDLSGGQDVSKSKEQISATKVKLPRYELLQLP